MPSAIKKLLAGLGIAGAGTVSEEAEAHPFFHASRKLFDKPKYKDLERSFGDPWYGQGFYGLADEAKDYYVDADLMGQADYGEGILNQAIKELGYQGVQGRNVSGLMDPSMPDPAKARARLLERKPELAELAGKADEVATRFPEYVPPYMYEYDFKVPVEELLDWNALPDAYPELVKDLLNNYDLDGDIKEILEKGHSIGTGDRLAKISDLAERIPHSFGPDRIEEFYQKWGFRGNKHLDDATGGVGYTSWFPEEDLELIKRGHMKY